MTEPQLHPFLLFDMYRFALLSLLVVGCIPPPSGGYQTQSYARQSAYSQQNGYEYWRQNGYSQQNGYDEEYEDGYGSSNSGYDSYGSSHGNARNAGGGSRAWTCGAEASFGTALGSGPMIYQVLAGVGYGADRQEASVAAINDCNSMVTAAMSIHGDERQEGGECGISRCNPSDQ